MKKLLLIPLLFLPAAAGAQGLVHCGGHGQAPCTFCDFFVLIDNVINFALKSIVPPLAFLMLVFAGGTFLLGSANPESIKKGKQIFQSVVIGLVLIYGSWAITNTVFSAINVKEWTGLRSGWSEIKCQETSPADDGS